MAYTYDDFVAAANNAGLLNAFSEADLTAAQSNPEYGMSMLKLQQDIGKATTAEQKLLAEEAANQLRKSYGTLTTPATGSSFAYGDQAAYDKLMGDITNYQPFEYDPNTDPRMAEYRKTYLREAERARADTLAKVSAASGGVPSSYAVGAAEQAGNYYTGKLNDVIPELFNDAYNKHMSDFSMKLNALGAMETDRQFDYNAWLGELEKKQQQWNNAMAMYQLLGYNAPQEYLDLLGIVKPVSTGDSGGSGGSGGSGNSAIYKQAEDILANGGYNSAEMLQIIRTSPLSKGEQDKLVTQYQKPAQKQEVSNASNKRKNDTSAYWGTR